MKMVREEGAVRAEMVRACVFDFGGVMTAPADRHADLPTELQGLLGFYLDEVKTWYHETSQDHEIHRMETGQLALDGYFASLCQRYGEATSIYLDPVEARHRVFPGFDPCQEMVDVVARLRASGFATALLTNMGREDAPVWRRVLGSDVERLFDTVVDSSDVGVRKPNPKIYALPQ